MQLVIETLQEIEINNVASLITESFTENEPLTRHIQVSKDCFCKWCKIMIKEIVDDKLCLIAKNNDGVIVGCLIAKTMKNEETPKSEEMKPIEDFLREISGFYPIEIDTNNTVHLSMVATKLGYEGNNICFFLIQELIKKATEINYEYIITELTSQETQHICLNKLGFKSQYEVDYKVYEAFKNLDGKCVLGVKKITNS